MIKNSITLLFTLCAGFDLQTWKFKTFEACPFAKAGVLILCDFVVDIFGSGGVCEVHPDADETSNANIY